MGGFAHRKSRRRLPKIIWQLKLEGRVYREIIPAGYLVVYTVFGLKFSPSVLFGLVDVMQMAQLLQVRTN